MRTPILEQHSQSAHDVKAQLPFDVQERSGDEFFQHYLESAKLSNIYKYAEESINLVRTLQHAVESRAPRILCWPGWQSKFLFFPLSIVSTSFIDHCYEKAVSVLTADVKK
ncbi:unnamed protein product [Rotaria magnacalcarata]|uniref:Uncharacterized protein n=1 Tax=Rotaria magnacalcarata TaxID=392030 RepID=A0A816SAV7_9BILA|nr:unnamed protein product [Rotaria magnacalcarata]